MCACGRGRVGIRRAPPSRAELKKIRKIEHLWSGKNRTRARTTSAAKSFRTATKKKKKTTLFSLGIVVSSRESRKTCSENQNSGYKDGYLFRENALSYTRVALYVVREKNVERKMLTLSAKSRSTGHKSRVSPPANRDTR